MTTAMRGRVLAIGGSDSGGGAGIQADLKTICALGAHGMSAVTALTAQDTRGVHAVHFVPLPFVRLQIELALADPGADAIKTGMLVDAETVAAVCTVLEMHDAVPLVVDPVLASTAGQSLLAIEAVAMLKRRLLPLASLLTPNIPEAEVLAGMPIASLADMHEAAAALLTLGVPAVLLKGGHLPGPRVVDLLATLDGVEAFESARIGTRHTHGTGCTLASGIATGLAQGLGTRDAVLRARAYVHAAIEAAPGFGAGHGPLNHAVYADPPAFALAS